MYANGAKGESWGWGEQIYVTSYLDEAITSYLNETFHFKEVNILLKYFLLNSKLLSERTTPFIVKRHIFNIENLC